MNINQRIIDLAIAQATKDVELYDVKIGNQLCIAREHLALAFELCGSPEDSQAILTHFHKQIQELINVIMDCHSTE